VGVKSRTKEQLQRLMYHEEMKFWMENARVEDLRLKVSAARLGEKLPKLIFKRLSYLLSLF
jgi:hypothetical protein